MSKIFYCKVVQLVLIAMSEEKSRFRVKRGDIEIEYEGTSSEVNVRYKEAFEWIRTVSPPKPQPDKGKTDKAKEKVKKTKGVATEVGKLIEDGWLDDWKRNVEVLKELERRAITGVYLQAVDSALRHRVGKTLERKKDEQGNWIYRRMKESGG